MGCSPAKPVPAPPLLRPAAARKRERSFKVVLLGDVFVGKTSLISFALSDRASPGGYSPTIGFAFSSKRFALPSGESVTLQLWDTCGQEPYRSLVSLYYRDAHAALCVFDYGSPASLAGLEHWLRELHERTDAAALVVKIVGNKADLKDRAGSLGEAEVAAALRRMRADGHERVDAYALSGENVRALFERVAAQCAG